MAIDGLIYDVGFHNGDDTAYYLARGYRVVAIEADPTLAQAGRERFAAEIAAGRLTMVDCAVGPENATATFYLCPAHRVWNSFDREAAGRNGLEVVPVEVRVRRFADILREHGVPHYLKIDIEGHDHHCLAGIDPADRPRYLSWELADLAQIYAMRDKGYTGFKCVGQSTFTPLTVGGRRGRQVQPLRHRLRGAALRALLATPGAMPAARAVKRAVKGPPPPEGRGAPVVRTVEWPGGSWGFRFGSSGPFGEDVGGEWKSADEVVYECLDVVLPARRARAAGQNPWTDWFDIHATTL